MSHRLATIPSRPIPAGMFEDRRAVALQVIVIDIPDLRLRSSRRSPALRSSSGLARQSSPSSSSKSKAYRKQADAEKPVNAGVDSATGEAQPPHECVSTDVSARRACDVCGCELMKRK
jgi:hypothetical protein